MSKDFSVITYSISDKIYKHWSDNLNMIITKGNTVLELNSEEIIVLVKALPRTIGGSYGDKF